MKYAPEIFTGAQGGNRTLTLSLERDFESRVSTNSTTWANKTFAKITNYPNSFKQLIQNNNHVNKNSTHTSFCGE